MASLAPTVDRARSTSVNNVVRLDVDSAWAAFERRDRSWDGRVIGAVKTTGIYCKPSCPARRPKREHVEGFHDARLDARGLMRNRDDPPPTLRNGEHVFQEFAQGFDLRAAQFVNLPARDLAVHGAPDRVRHVGCIDRLKARVRAGKR